MTAKKNDKKPGKTSKSLDPKTLKHGADEPAPKPEPKVEPKTDAAKVEAVKEKVSKEKKEKATVSANMMDSLKALKAGKPMTHNEIATITKREKGNRLRELDAAGLITTTEQEGIRGYVFTITAAGKKLLTDAK